MDIFADYKDTCVNCTKPLGPVYMKCMQAQCNKENVHLCLLCMSLAAECGAHKKNHDYKIVSENGPKVFPGSSFGIDECQTLLEVIDMKFSLGNWEDTKKLLKTCRTPQEIKELYDRYFIRGRIGQATLLKEPLSAIVDHTDVFTTNSTAVELSPPVKERTLKQNQQDLKLLAYMPHRDDFEKEWANDAEFLLTSQIVLPDDDETVRKLRLAQVDHYLRLVRERRRRKYVARSYNLVPEFFKKQRPQSALVRNYIGGTSGVGRKVGFRDMKELRDDLKRFCQYLPPEEFEKLLTDLVKERVLKQRLTMLANKKRQGWKKLDRRSRQFDLDSNIDSTKKFRAKRKRLRLSYSRQKGVARYMRWRKIIADQTQSGSNEEES